MIPSASFSGSADLDTGAGMLDFSFAVTDAMLDTTLLDPNGDNGVDQIEFSGTYSGTDVPVSLMGGEWLIQFGASGNLVGTQTQLFGGGAVAGTPTPLNPSDPSAGLTVALTGGCQDLSGGLLCGIAFGDFGDFLLNVGDPSSEERFFVHKFNVTTGVIPEPGAGVLLATALAALAARAAASRRIRL